MTELLAYGEPRTSVQGALLGTERSGPRSTRSWSLPTGHLLVAILRVLVPEPVESRESGVGRVSFVDAKLLAVVAIAGNQ
jgi:hypothetical protein